MRGAKKKGESRKSDLKTWCECVRAVCREMQTQVAVSVVFALVISSSVFFFFFGACKQFVEGEKGMERASVGERVDGGECAAGAGGEFGRTGRVNEKVGECKWARCYRKQRRAVNAKTRSLGDAARRSQSDERGCRWRGKVGEEGGVGR